MKKLSKFELIITICIMIGTILSLIASFLETVVGEEMLWLKIPANIVFFYSSLIISGVYAANVIIKIIDNYNEKKHETSITKK